MDDSDEPKRTPPKQVIILGKLFKGAADMATGRDLVTDSNAPEQPRQAVPEKSEGFWDFFTPPVAVVEEEPPPMPEGMRPHIEEPTPPREETFTVTAEPVEVSEEMQPVYYNEFLNIFSHDFEKNIQPEKIHVNNFSFNHARIPAAGDGLPTPEYISEVIFYNFPDLSLRKDIRHNGRIKYYLRVKIGPGGLLGSINQPFVPIHPDELVERAGVVMKNFYRLVWEPETDQSVNDSYGGAVIKSRFEDNQHMKQYFLRMDGLLIIEIEPKDLT